MLPTFATCLSEQKHERGVESNSQAIFRFDCCKLAVIRRSRNKRAQLQIAFYTRALRTILFDGRCSSLLAFRLLTFAKRFSCPHRSLANCSSPRRQQQQKKTKQKNAHVLSAGSRKSHQQTLPPTFSSRGFYLHGRQKVAPPSPFKVRSICFLFASARSALASASQRARALRARKRASSTAVGELRSVGGRWRR